MLTRVPHDCPVIGTMAAFDRLHPPINSHGIIHIVKPCTLIRSFIKYDGSTKRGVHLRGVADHNTIGVSSL